jgi:hypothetical protein
MKRTASERKSTKSSACSTEMKRSDPQFVICVRNEKYQASLELRKLYQTVPDEKAARLGHVRVIDESGEDYLYPEDYFVAVRLPAATGKAVLRATA